MKVLSFLSLLAILVFSQGVDARVIDLATGKGKAQIQIHPSQFKAGDAVKVQIEAYEKLSEPDPNYGNKRPLSGKATVSIKKKSFNSKRKLTRVGDIGGYAFHFMPPSNGKFKLNIQIEKFEFFVEFISGKWKLEKKEVKKQDSSNLVSPLGLKGASIRSDLKDGAFANSKIKKVKGQRNMRGEVFWGDRVLGFRLYKSLCVGSKKKPALEVSTSSKYCELIKKAKDSPAMLSKAKPGSWHKIVSSSQNGLDKSINKVDLADTLAYLQGFSIPLKKLIKKGTHYTLFDDGISEKNLTALEKAGFAVQGEDRPALYVVYKKGKSKDLTFFANNANNLENFKKKFRIGYSFYGKFIGKKDSKGVYALFMDTNGRVLNVLGSTPRISKALRALKKQGNRKKTKRFKRLNKKMAKTIFKDWKVHLAAALTFEQKEYNATWADSEFKDSEESSSIDEENLDLD